MKSKAWVFLGACVSSIALPELAEACGGGGVVSSRPGSVGADAQRVFISVHDDGVGGSFDGTHVITQITVPATTDDYGALLPLPSEPTLDATPVATRELEQLDMATAPQLLETEDSGGSGFSCGCGSEAGGSKGARASASEPVDIGPVTAVVLTGTTDAVNGWLGENGFVISAADQAMVADYAGYYFVAIRRNDRAAPGGPTSIGIHFSMPGDHRELPLRFASLGAASTVAFTLFIATSETVAPSPPFAALTLDDLDGGILRTVGYRQAVESAIRAHDNRAFVLESSTSSAELNGRLAGTAIGSLLVGTTVTRMTTILPAEALTEDAHFYDPYPGHVPNERNLNTHNAFESREANIGAVTGLVLLGMWRRRKRPALFRDRA